MDYTNAFPGRNGTPAAGLDAFDSTEAAPEFAPLPAGTYAARVVRGEYCTDKNQGGGRLPDSL